MSPRDQAQAGRWIDRVVADAVSDYAHSTFETRDRRTRVLAAGVTRRAHSWCVDLKGSVDALVNAGVLAEWFEGREECKEIAFRGRRVEIFRGFGRIEVSIRYSDVERELISDVRHG